MSRSILITGATGKQGGSVINAILGSPKKNDFTLFALTRSTESASARKLAARADNVKLVQGNLDDMEGVFTEAEKQNRGNKIWGVFSVQTPMGHGAAGEEKQGKALVDAALSHGVEFFVYSSVDRNGNKSLSNPTDIPHFISKYNIEKHLIAKTNGGEGGPMGYTILRPVAFMDNFTADFVGKVLPTAWESTIPKDKPLQLVATKDIGTFAARAFEDPQKYNKREIALAGDSLTHEQMASVFKEKTGKDVPQTYWFVAWAIMWLSKELGTMVRWFGREGYGADVQQCRKENPSMMDFGTWLEKESAYKK